MAISTGDFVVSRQAAIEKELLAQLDFCGMTSIAGGNWHGGQQRPMSGTDIPSSTMVPMRDRAWKSLTCLTFWAKPEKAAQLAADRTATSSTL
jgi:hypothetical protein